MSSTARTPDTKLTSADKLRHMANNSDIPTRMYADLLEAANTLDWQELILSGLKEDEKNAVGALSKLVNEQRRQINGLNTELHQHSATERRRKVELQEQMQKQMLIKHLSKYEDLSPTGRVPHRSIFDRHLEKTFLDEIIQRNKNEFNKTIKK